MVGTQVCHLAEMVLRKTVFWKINECEIDFCADCHNLSVLKKSLLSLPLPYPHASLQNAQ